jgi:hypothetical protein
MLYLGVGQHARQITISLRDERGDVLMARQPRQRPEKIHEFFQRLTRERLQSGRSFVGVLATDSQRKTPDFTATLLAKLGRLAKS